jgi:hypothetical protein
MYKILTCLIIFTLGGASNSFAQSYGTTAGLRLGNNNHYRTLGVSAKHRLVKGLTAEAILQSDFNVNTTAHLLIARHRPLISRRFNYYYGAGASMGIEESREKIADDMQIIHTYGNPTLGVDLVIGVEFTLLKMNVSLDYKPNVNIVGREPWYQGQVGLSVRHVLVKGSEQNKKRRQKTRKKRRAERNQKEIGPFTKIIRSIKGQ